MPEILVGYPNYDFNECLLYIISSLENDGFLLNIHPNLLLISWNHWIPQYVRDKIRKKTGKIIDKFGNDITTQKADSELIPKKKRFRLKNQIKQKM